jgi:hypothetical protein
MATLVPPASARSLTAQNERDLVRDALHIPGAILDVGSSDIAGAVPANAIDGSDDTAYIARAGADEWVWSSRLARPAHLGLIRAHFGASPTSGIPTDFQWQVLRPSSADPTCPTGPLHDDSAWQPLSDAEQARLPWGVLAAQPTRRSWFVDADACGLRLVVHRTNAGPPVIREVRAIESAQDVLRNGRASDDGAYPGFQVSSVFDSSYATRWAGAPGRRTWTLRVDLPSPRSINRIRLVMGFDATSVPRQGVGRNYAIAWAPVRYRVEASEDGESFAAIASEPRGTDGAIVPVRRRTISLERPMTVRALRIAITGATNERGVLAPDGVPVIRQFAAFGADDPRPVLAPPWVLSVDANPSAQMHLLKGAEIGSDVYRAGFLQARLAKVMPQLRRDMRYARMIGPHGELLSVPSSDADGEALEAIEADDALLTSTWLRASDPPPIVVLSGSNDWDYADHSGPDPFDRGRWHWDPLRPSSGGGMGGLVGAVQDRVAPFLGFCGGAQILALLEAGASSYDDQETIDRILQRINGTPIRGFAPSSDSERAWPWDPQPERADVHFDASDPLFTDLAGTQQRSSTRAFAEWHSDAVRPDAFLPDGPLRRFALVARSAFCGPDVVTTSRADGSFANPSGSGWCEVVPQVFRSRDAAWPVVGVQFHPEQRDFSTSVPPDPPESVADPRLFLAGAYEEVVNAYEQQAL